MVPVLRDNVDDDSNEHLPKKGPTNGKKELVRSMTVVIHHGTFLKQVYLFSRHFQFKKKKLIIRLWHFG